MAVWLQSKVGDRGLGLRLRLNDSLVCDAQSREGCIIWHIRGLRRYINCGPFFGVVEFSLTGWNWVATLNGWRESFLWFCSDWNGDKAIVLTLWKAAARQSHNKYIASQAVYCSTRLSIFFVCVTDRVSVQPWSKPALTDFDLQPKSHTQPLSAVWWSPHLYPCN